MSERREDPSWLVIFVLLCIGVGLLIPWFVAASAWSGIKSVRDRWRDPEVRKFWYSTFIGIGALLVLVLIVLIHYAVR